MSAEELKAQGNAAFSAGNYEEAIDIFTKAIDVDGSNHVLYSNRSAAKASLHQYDGALEDAEKCVELRPDWPKGYSRLGAAHYGLKRWEDAIKAYEEGMQKALEDAQAASAGPASGPSGNPLASMFGPQMLAKLATNPATRALLSQPDFMAMIQDVQSKPENFTKYLNDPRMQMVLQAVLGAQVMTPERAAASAASGDGMPSPMDLEPAPEASKKPEPTPEPAAAAAPEPEPELSPEEQEKRDRHDQALKEKEKGNQAYKAKQFEEAIAHYNRALELFDGDISFLTNRAAVHFEMGSYDACIEDCSTAVTRGRELRADFKLIARALARKGSALVKLERLEEAVEVLGKALTEHRTPETLKRLNETEKALKTKREREMVDLALAEQEKERGNKLFKEDQYPEAVKAYTEALKRGPAGEWPDAYKVFSNRAACYTKLGAWSDGLKDAEKCIELAPEFAKGYSRKGALQFMMKDYDKAMETYEQGLAKAPDNQELRDGKMRCVEKLSQIMSGQASEEELKERRAKAMEDPEIQTILTDPIMAQVLRDFEQDPRSAQKHLRNPEIARKLQRLVTAGIVRLG